METRPDPLRGVPRIAGPAPYVLAAVVIAMLVVFVPGLGLVALAGAIVAVPYLLVRRRRHREQG